jgi:hypothetical protein
MPITEVIKQLLAIYHEHGDLSCSVLVEVGGGLGIPVVSEGGALSSVVAQHYLGRSEVSFRSLD